MNGVRDNNIIAPAFDAWLQRRGIVHSGVRALVRLELVLTALLLLAGCGLYPFVSWPFWFAIGYLLMAMTFWGLARQFPSLHPDDWSRGLLVATLFRWVARLLLAALVIYLALVLCKAPVLALLGGITLSLASALPIWWFANGDAKSCNTGAKA